MLRPDLADDSPGAMPRPPGHHSFPRRASFPACRGIMLTCPLITSPMSMSQVTLGGVIDHRVGTKAFTEKLCAEIEQGL